MLYITLSIYIPLLQDQRKKMNTLLFQKHSKNDDLKTTLYNVYKAKKNSEAMQGVGKETEIGYLNKKGIKMLNEKNIKILNNIYHAELNFGKENKKLR